METEPIFADWQAVTMDYWNWHRERYPVECFVHSSRFIEQAEWEPPGFFYRLRIPHIYDLDPVDYRALEGDNRDLYGWMPESTLTLREEGAEGVPES